MEFYPGITLPVRPMIGAIGVAPPGDPVYTVHPGVHGGNMDNNRVEVGAKVYLPVFVSGGLFALGDVHATMGDGETSGGGLDIAADVKVRLTVVKGIKLRRPVILTPTCIVATYNAPTLREAVRGVVAEGVRLLMEHLKLPVEEAIMLVSTAGDVRLCQAGDTGVDVTVRLELPRLFSL